jgi:hypothetical protein
VAPLAAPLPVAITPASPERLRGEACPLMPGPLEAAFLEHLEPGAASPQAGSGDGSPAGAARATQRQQQEQQGQALRRDELQGQQPSPASPAWQNGLTGGVFSPLGLSPLSLPEMGAAPPQAGQGQTGRAVAAAACEKQQKAGDSKDSVLVASHCGSAAAPAVAASDSVGGHSGSGSCGGSSSNEPAGAETGSDAKVARFLSRLPCVTLVRGGCMPRLAPGDSSSSSTAGTGSGIGGCGGGAAAPPDWRVSNASSGSSGASQGRYALRCIQLQWGAEEQHSPAVQQAGSVGAASNGGAQDRCSLGSQGCTPPGSGMPAPSPVAPSSAPQPPPLSVPRRWRNGSVMRMRQSLQAPGGLPATTLIHLGPPLQRPPPGSTLEGVAEWHCASSGGGGGNSSSPALPQQGEQQQRQQGPLQAAFYASAEALPEGGPEMTFVAGGARCACCQLPQRAC